MGLPISSNLTFCNWMAETPPLGNKPIDQDLVCSFFNHIHKQVYIVIVVGIPETAFGYPKPDLCVFAAMTSESCFN